MCVYIIPKQIMRIAVFRVLAPPPWVVIKQGMRNEEMRNEEMRK